MWLGGSAGREPLQQLFWPDAGHLAKTRVAPPTDAEVCPAVICAYPAHAGARCLAYECAAVLNVINTLYLPTMF